MIYSIPIIWESYKRYEVEANTLEEGIIKALNIFLAEPDEFYIEDSFSLDEIIYDENPDEDFDFCQIISKLRN